MSDGQMGAVVQYLRGLVGSPGTGEPTDSQLLERFTTRHEEEAFAALMLRHGPMVQGVCRRVLNHAQDAEDVFQATFLVLARKASSVRKDASLASWLYGVAYRLALKARTAAARRRARERRASTMTNAEDVPEVDQRELRAVLDEELSRLPEKCRTPLVLCYLEGKTQEEAARMLGCPMGSMSWRLARARDQLRERLAHRGVTLAAATLAVGLGEAAAVATPLLERTMKAALLFATGKPAPATLVSTHALSLAETSLRAFAGKLKFTLAALLVLAAVGAGAVLAHHLLTPGRPAVRNMDVRRPPVRQAVKPAAARVWRERTTFRVSGSRVRGLALAKGGKQLAALGMEDFIPNMKDLIRAQAPKLWDATTGKEGRILTEERDLVMISSVAFSPDGKTLATAEEGVVLWDVGSGKVRATYPETAVLGLVTFSPDGKTLAYGPVDGGIRLCDLRTGKLRRLPRAAPLLNHCAFAANGKRLVSVTVDGTLQVWDVAGGRLLATRKLGLQQAPHLLSPNAKTLACPGPGNNIQLWDVGTGKFLATLKRPQSGPLATAAAFAPDGKTLAAGNGDGTVTLWDVAAYKKAVTFQGLKGEVTSVVFAPDGKTLAAGDENGTVKVWRLENKRDDKK